jgi:hypothetical protein
MNEFVYCLPGILVFVVFSSPPLLSLFLLRRPSFARVLLHVATALYILLIIYIVYIFTRVTSPNLLWKYVAFTFLLVHSGGALVAGLPEATAAGRWTRLVYYAAPLLWIYFVLYLMNLAENLEGRILGTYRFNAIHLVTLVEPQVAEFPAQYAVVWNKSCLKTLLASVSTASARLCAVAAVSAAASLDVCKYEFYDSTRDVERRHVHKRDERHVPPDVDVEPYVKGL